MNDHLENQLSDDELRDAFDVNPAEPTAEHLERLRHQIALNTKPATVRQSVPLQPSNEFSRSFHFPVSISVIVAIAIIVVLVARPFVKDATADLQSTLNATREARWIHGSTTIKHAEKTSTAESWCSPAERIVAFRSNQFLHFVDYELGLQSSYTEQNGKVFQWKANPHGESMGREFVFALLNDQGLQASFPFHEVSKVKKSAVEVHGQSGTEYLFEVQKKDDPSISWSTSVTTDPITGRIILWKDQHASGMMVTTSFKYPGTGPSDIFELGVPPETDVVEIDVPKLGDHEKDGSGAR